MTLKKILFSFAGHRDPFGDGSTEGSVVTLVRHIHPDEVVLIAVNEQGTGFANEVAEWIHLEEVTGLPRESIFVETEAGDPVDYTFTLSTVCRVLEKHRERWMSDNQDGSYEFVANASSGTPSMKAAMLLVKHMGLLGTGAVYQVRDPKFVTETRPRVSEVPIGFLEESNRRDLLFQAIESQEFHHARSLLKSLSSTSISDGVRQSHAWLKHLLDGFEHWELSQYKDAKESMSRSYKQMPETSALSSLRAFVKEQTDWLEDKQLLSSHETDKNLFELYQSVCRYHQNKRFTDGLARFWRLLEGTIVWRLKQIQDQKPVSADEKQQQHVASTLKAQKKGTVPVFALLHVLETIGDPPFVRWLRSPMPSAPDAATIDEQLRRLRRQRNDSLAAHGMSPVSEADMRQAVFIARQLMDCVLPNARNLEVKYPFRPKKAVELLKAYWTGVV